MQQIQLELEGGGTLTVCLRASLDAMPTVKQRPLVLVVPGGGYSHVSPREGDPVALQADGQRPAALKFQLYLLHRSVFLLFYTDHSGPLYGFGRAK